MNFNIIDSYIYFYHLADSKTGSFIVLPSMPGSITDTLQATFNQSSLLSRSAPIFTYASSGPRSIQVTLRLHRDMMQLANYGTSDFNIDIGDDYIDTLIKNIQAIALPRYDSTSKLVDPPIVALRFGNEVFIKGVISGNLSITYSGPISSDGKYNVVDLSFNISEIDPIDATIIQQVGSFRSIPRTLEKRIYKSAR